MKHEMNERELERDPVLAAALRWAEGEVPMDDVDWTALRSNIRERAELPLARRRALQTVSRRWLRPVVPLAVAAGLAGVMWLGVYNADAPTDPSLAPMQVSEAAATTFQEVLLSDVSDQEFRLLMAEHYDSDDLLLIAASVR